MAERRSDRAPPRNALPSQAERLVAADVFAAVASSVLSSLMMFLVAALALQIGRSLHFGVAALGLVISIYYLSAAVSSVPLSRGVEAIGSLRAMRGGCALMGLLMLLLAGLVQSYAGLVAIMIGAGIVAAGLQPATNLFLVRRIPSAHHGFAFGIKQAAVPMAVILGGLAVPAIALTVGWRWAFVAAAALAFTTSLIMPRSKTSFAEYRAHPPVVDRLGGRGVVNLLVLTVGFALSVAAASALSAFAVTALVAAGQTEGAAGLLAGVGGFSAAITRIAVGVQADRGRGAHLLVVALMLGLGAVAYLALAVATATLPALLIPAVVLAFAAGWGWNGLFNLAIVRRYPTQAARATGITSVGGRAGGVIGPLVFGLVVTHGSYTWAWLIAALSAISGALILLVGRRLLDRGARIIEQQPIG